MKPGVAKVPPRAIKVPHAGGCWHQQLQPQMCFGEQSPVQHQRRQAQGKMDFPEV